MKKSKIMLTAVVVMAVVGGALAFKAKKGGQEKCIYTTTTTTTDVGGITIGTCVFSTFESVAYLTSAGASLYITTKDTYNDACPQVNPGTGQKFRDCTLFSTTVAE